MVPETVNALPVLSVSALPKSRSLPRFPAQSASLSWSSAQVWWSSAPSFPVWWSSAPPWRSPALSAPHWWAPALSAPPWRLSRTGRPMSHSGGLLLRSGGHPLCRGGLLLRSGGFLLRLLCYGDFLLRPGGPQSRLLRPGGLRSHLHHPGGLLSRLLRPGGLLSRLLRPGGLRSRLFSPGGLRSCLLHLGTLLCRLWLGSWSHHFHMDLALRPSPGSTSASPPSWIVLCLERLEAAPWGGYVTNPVHALPVTHHQRSLAHHTDSCTTLMVPRHLRLNFP